MRKAVYIAAVALAVLHQDFWLWDDDTLLLGFLPAGLGYHILYSILASGVWTLAIVYAWPSDVENLAEENPTGSD